MTRKIGQLAVTASLVALLAGPAEIYLDDEYLVTSPIRTVPADLIVVNGLVFTFPHVNTVSDLVFCGS